MIYTWDDVPPDMRTMLVSVYNDRDAITAAAAGLGLSYDNLRRRIREHRLYTETLFHEKPEGEHQLAVREILKTALASAQVQSPTVVRSIVPAPTKLTDLHYIDPTTDQGTWLEWLHDARSTKGNITVGHFSDVHAPFQNKAACSVGVQLMGHVQPDAIGVGSDFADFALLTPFKIDPDIADGTDDVLDEFEREWHAHIDALIAASPRTVLFYLLGNHERRIYNLLAAVPKFRKTLMRRFIEIVRYRGVLWLGETDYARMGPLVVMHGNRHNIHASKSMLEDMGGQVSAMAGHKHYLTSFHISGEDYSAHGITSGCHMERVAHYNRGRKQNRKYALGTAFADVDLNGREVTFTNLEYTEYPDRVGLRFERRDFSAPVVRPQGFITFEEYLASKQEDAEQWMPLMS